MIRYLRMYVNVACLSPEFSSESRAELSHRIFELYSCQRGTATKQGSRNKTPDARLKRMPSTFFARNSTFHRTMSPSTRHHAGSPWSSSPGVVPVAVQVLGESNIRGPVLGRIDEFLTSNTSVCNIFYDLSD
jgi:hypothetical protein